MKRLLAMIVLCALPATVRAQDMNLFQVLAEGEGWKPVGRGFKALAGLAGDGKGNLYVAEKEGRVFHISKDGEPKPLAHEFDAIRGMSLAPDGVLYLALGGKKGMEEDTKIARLTLAKGEPKETPVRGLRDVLATRRGTVYYIAEKGVFLMNADGSTRKVGAGLGDPSGLALTPDQGTLVVGDADDKCLWAFRVDPDGSLVHKEPYYAVWVPRGEVASGTAALTADAGGRVYATTKYGVQMFDPTGRLSGILRQPAGYSAGAIAFGGADSDMLYLACGDRLYGRKLKVKGTFPDEKAKQ